MNGMEDPVHKIRGKYLDKFQGQFTGSTSWLNLGHEWLKRKFYILEPDFYKKLSEKDIEGQDIETYKTFAVPFYITKVNLSMINYSVTPNKEGKQQVMMKKNPRIKNIQVIRKKNQRRNLWHQFLGKK